MSTNESRTEQLKRRARALADSIDEAHRMRAQLALRIAQVVLHNRAQEAPPSKDAELRFDHLMTSFRMAEETYDSLYRQWDQTLVEAADAGLSEGVKTMPLF